MSSSDWEEVKRLAADFQRAQLTSAAQRLTDRNCVEIINKLLELKLLDVVFTTDGKEYVTPQQLSREILDELYVHGGRLALSDLSTNLNVSLNVITARVVELIKTEKNCHFVLGQLLTSNYLDSVAYDLNEKLSQDGVLNLNDVSKNIDLPGEFLHEQLLRRLGKIIKGKRDEDEPCVIYTEAFVRRNTARVRGIMSAITKPTPVNQILGKVQHLPDRLFFQIVNKLLCLKRVDGIISGTSRSGYYIPSIYSKAQVNYIEGFMKGNGYIDLEVASRLGISDPKSFVQKRFPNEELTFLKTCCLGETLFKQVKESVEESLVSPGWIDVSVLLPFSVTEKDVEMLLKKMINPNSFVFGSTIVNKSVVSGVQANFKPLMEEKALKDIESGRYIQLISEIRANEKKSKMAELNASEYDSRSHKKEDRRKKAAGGKGGGGTQGRETKTKSTKKKYMAGKRDESESEEETKQTSSGSTKATVKTQLPFLSQKEIQNMLRKEETLKEGQDDLLSIIASKLVAPLTDEYQLVLKTTYDIFVTEKCGRKSKEELLQRTKKHLNALKLYSEGLMEFDGDVKTQIEKYIIRTFGQEVINSITQFLLVEAGLEADGKVTDLPDETSASLYQLGKIPSPAQLLQDIELLFQLKADKNLDLQLLETKESLRTELTSAKEAGDPALFLHIFMLLTFSLKTKKLIQASGKFVPQILLVLQSKLAADEFVKIKSYQDAVMQYIKSKGTSGGLEMLYQDLESMLKTFK